MVNATLRPLYPRHWAGTHCVKGWVGSRAGPTGVENLDPHRFQSLDRPTHIEPLFRLRYHGPFCPVGIAACSPYYIVWVNNNYKSFSGGLSLRVKLCILGTFIHAGGLGGGLLKRLWTSERPCTHVTTWNCWANFHEFIWKNFTNNCLSISVLSDVSQILRATLHDIEASVHVCVCVCACVCVENTLLKTNR